MLWIAPTDVPPDRPSAQPRTSRDSAAGAPAGVSAGDERGGRLTPTRTGNQYSMAQPQLQDLLEAGVHFGHQTRRWNPKMRRFIFAERSGIYIIDLQKTLRQIGKAQELLRSVVLKGDGVLFVCTRSSSRPSSRPRRRPAGRST